MTDYKQVPVSGELTLPDVATQILNLIEDECRYWHGRDESRRGDYAILYAKAKELISKQKSSPDELSEYDRGFRDGTLDRLIGINNAITAYLKGEEP